MFTVKVRTTGLLFLLYGLITPQHVHAVEITRDFFISKCGSPGQRCAKPFSVDVQTGSTLQVRYIVSKRHCSPVLVRLSVDGKVKATSPFLGWPGGPPSLPLETVKFDLGPVTPGSHRLSIEAEGRKEGCNRGRLFSWGGTLKIETDAVAETADLAVTKGGASTVLAGTNITYTVNVTNNGPNEAKSVAFTDPLPANTTFISNTQNSGPSFNCTAPAGSVNCIIPKLAAGASAKFTLVYNVPTATPAGTGITNKAFINSSATKDPATANNSASAATVTEILRWKRIPQNLTGPLFPEHFQATVRGGALILSLFERADGDGVALTFVRQEVTRLEWRRLPQNFGGPLFPEHFQAVVPNGALIVSVLTRAQGQGLGLAFLPQQVARLNFVTLQQSQSGPLFPDALAAPAAGGSLVLSFLTRASGTGVGLGFVPGAVGRLDWQNVQQNQNDPLFPEALAAPVGGGALVLSLLNRAQGVGVAIDFVPQAPGRLDWQIVGQDLGGPLVPEPRRATVPRGALFMELLNRARGTAVGLTFVPE